ncbi:MAG: ATPase, T2SS/T4P/T4SS family [Planctomycetota bacterium]|jgi:type II secretory ATPase GspE/PulE/Tfp pilus assembly ATPase PilB-like protein
MGLREDQAKFFGKVGALMGAGVPMLRAFEVAQERVETPALREALKRIMELTYHGNSVTESFATEGSHFTKEVLCLLQTGEEMGDLEKKASAIARGLLDGSFDPGRPDEEASGEGDRLSSLLEDSRSAGASDVHVEPLPEGALVRLRVESSLRAEKTLTGEECRELIGLAKRRGRLDPAVSDRAQAGWFEWNEHVVRVSTCPYAPGEGLVLRIIDATPREVRLEETGMTKSAAAAVRSWLADGHGLVLVAGPRTSGRRSTLAALLSELDRERGKVSTIEETPAVAVPGVSRVRLRPGEGFDRAAGLRAQLEQDLDAVCAS